MVPAPAHPTFEGPPATRFRWRWPFITTLLSLILCTALTWIAWSGAQMRDRGRFENLVQRTHAAIAARIDLYISLLRASSGLFTADTEITRQKFEAFERRIDLRTNYPGIQGIGYARVTPREELPALIAKLRAEGEPDFRVFPASDNTVLMPIVCLEPRDRRNLHAIGYDMASDATRLEAMMRACDSGQPAVTSRVVLVQEIDPVKQAGVLVYFPIYRSGLTPDTVEERRATLAGFVYSPLRVDDLLGGLLAGETSPGVSFDIFDDESTTPESLLHRSAHPALPAPRLARLSTLPVADREWTVRYASTSGFESRSTRKLVGWIASAGLVVSLCMAAIAFALARALSQTELRERELYQQKERLRVTLASIGDAVICTDAQGRIEFINPVAEKLSGWTPTEALGRPLAECFPMVDEETHEPIETSVEQVIRGGGKVHFSNHTALIARDGAHIPIEDSAAPIRTRQGELAGVVLVFHDVTKKREADAALRERERLLAAVAGGAAAGLAIVRDDYRYAFANEAFARIFDCPPHEIVGGLASEVCRQAWGAMRSGLDAALAGNSVRHELMLTTGPTDGRRRYYAVNYEPVGDTKVRAAIVVMLDVTVSKQAEEKLAASEERLRLATEAAQLGTWDYDAGGGRLYWDERTKTLCGVPDREHVSLETFSSLLHPEDRQYVERAIERSFETGAPGLFDVENRIIRPNDGEVRWVRATGQVYHFNHYERDGSRPRGSRLVGIVQDITAAKRREAALSFLVDLDSAIQRLPDPEDVIGTATKMLGEHLDADRCVYAEVENEAEFVVSGIRGENARRVPSMQGRWPVSSFGEACRRAMLTNHPFVVTDSEHDERIAPEDLGTYRATAIRATICVPLHQSGRFIAAMAVHQTHARDWTPDEIHLVEMSLIRCWESLARGRALRALLESERKLRFMAESMPQKIFTALPDGRIDYVNRQWFEFAGHSPPRLDCDWEWTSLLHPEDRDETVRLWNKAVSLGEGFQIEHRFRRHDGEYRWSLTHASPLRAPDGTISMWIGSTTDVTEIAKARETLAERRAELERLVDERTASLRTAIEQMEEFSYSISHDLRAPLRAMRGYAQALLEDYGSRLDAEGHDYLRRIIAASSRMDRLTLDVLTYSKVAREPVQPQRIKLDALVTDCVRQYLDFRDSRADIIIDHPIPDVLGYEPLLMQVVSNLVGNALKFVAPDVSPRVHIHAETRGTMVRLWFDDNGIGVPPDFQRRIWGMFERAHPPGSYSGTGIGLAIVRKAMERMGGEVGVESDGHSGSRFWIQLPTAAPEPMDSAPTTRPRITVS